MKKNHRVFLFSIPMILALLFSTLEAIPVSAEDVTPPTDPIVEPVDSAPADPTEEVVLTDTTSTEPTEVAVSEDAAPTEAPTEEAPAQEVTEAAPILLEESVDTLPEILAAVPDGTEIVVLDENGNAQSLASQEAAETLVQGDPVWCPEGVSPGSVGCTSSYITFNELIDVLEADAALGAGAVYKGSGVIWVADSYDGNDISQIAFDGNALINIRSSNLTIQGGWADGTGDAGTAGASEITRSMIFTNWIGNLAINNIFIDSSQPVNFGLYVDTDGTINLDNVRVTNTSTGPAGTNDGADLFSGGNITIEDSQFNSNDRNGLEARSESGNILLTNVTAVGNSLTGAYLDTCNLSVGGCLGTGNITVDGTSIFSDNDLDGLNIVSGGSANISNATASVNGLTGILITNGSNGTGGTVSVSSVTTLDNGADGLSVGQLGSGNVSLSFLVSTGNAFGAEVFNYFLGNLTIEMSEFLENDYTGLHIGSVGNVSLDNVTASTNDSNGAYLISDVNITIEDSTFNDNVHTASPADPGLYAEAGGDITLRGVIANNNELGAGAVLVAIDDGTITVGDTSELNSNGTFGLQAEANGGNISVSNTFASFNTVKGAYLKGSGLSEITLANSTFVENGNFGIYASTDQGDINLSNISEMGDNGIAPLDDATDIGAKLVSGSGNIFVTYSTFGLNTDTGLVVVGNKTATLNNVTSTKNGVNEIAIYSSYTEKGCFCSGDTPTSILVTIDSGIIGDINLYAQHGLYVRPGTKGNVTFTTVPTYGTFGPQENKFVLDMTELPECTKCGCETPEEKPEGKPYQIVEVSFSGSENIPQECSIFAGTILQLPDGTFVKVTCPFDGFSSLQGLTESDLPGLLGAGNGFDLGFLLGLSGKDGTAVLNSDGTITITFKIPETTRGRSHRMLFWDTTLNEGAGSWYQLPPYEKGTSFPLHPDDPSDPRMIVNGVSQNGNTMSITVNFGGTFVMVSN